MSFFLFVQLLIALSAYLHPRVGTPGFLSILLSLPSVDTKKLKLFLTCKDNTYYLININPNATENTTCTTANIPVLQ